LYTNRANTYIGTLDKNGQNPQKNTPAVENAEKTAFNPKKCFWHSMISLQDFIA